MSGIPGRRLSPSQAYRTAEDVCVIDEVHTHPLDPFVYGTTVAGAGAVSHVPSTSVIAVGVSTASGDRALLRTHARPRANARRGRTAVIVCSASSAPLNQKQRWGEFTDTDGLFFEVDGGTLFAVRRIAGVDTRVSRSSWSANATTLVDPTKPHAWEIRDAWPSGTTQFFVDGELMHEMSGTLSFRSARLPVSVECVNAGTTITSGTVSVSSIAVFVESSPEADRTFSVDGYGAAVTGTPVALAAIRPTALSGGLANDAEIAGHILTLSCSAECIVRLIQGATLTGTWANQAGSLAESSAPSAFSGGTVLASFVVQSSLGLQSDDALFRALRVLADGSQDSLAIVALSASGAPIAVRCALVWKETR